MSEEPGIYQAQNPSADPDVVRSNAMNVATWLRTSHRAKKHGGYDIYEDEKIGVSLDTYVPNLHIWIKDRDRMVTVYSAAFHSGPSIFHPGTWQEYLASLIPAAEAAARIVIEQKAEKERIERIRHYAPVNDAHIFKAG